MRFDGAPAGNPGPHCSIREAQGEHGRNAIQNQCRCVSVAAPALADAVWISGERPPEVTERITGGQFDLKAAPVAEFPPRREGVSP